jgi:hypothetical protein
VDVKEALVNALIERKLSQHIALTFEERAGILNLPASPKELMWIIPNTA